MNYISDELFVYPLVKKSDFLFTTYNVSPNSITLCNAFFITPLLLFSLQYRLLYSFILFYIRSYCDCLDGYIARKYKQTSKLGEIYDHAFDSITLGYLSLLLCDNIILSYFIACIGIFYNFNQELIKKNEYLSVVYSLFGVSHEGGYNVVMSYLYTICLFYVN